MNPLMFRIFPTQSGIVAIMSRQLIRHCRKTSGLRVATLARLFLAIVVVFAGLIPSMTMAVAAEYIVEDREPPALIPRTRTPRNAPDPAQLASGSLSFDGLVGKESTSSILQPIAEDANDDSSWSSEGASVSVIDDAEARYVDDLESEWVVSGDPYEVNAQPLCDDSSAWDWTHGLNAWGNACKDACGNMNLFHACKDSCRNCGPACWTGRFDTMILWRNAPSDRALLTNATTGAEVLNADQLNSDVLAAPRISLFRTNACGASFETTYIYAGNFYSERGPFTNVDQVNIFNNPTRPTFNQSADATLLGRFQSLEFNSRTPNRYGNIQFLAGIRWLQWKEWAEVTGTGTGTGVPANQFTDTFSTECFNDLYGGQIGLDSLLYTAANGFRIEALIKAGVYYNSAVQTSNFTVAQTVGGNINKTVRADGTPAGGAFMGELGMTSVFPVTRNFDFRLGYTGFWLESLAEPINQFSGQTIDATPGNPSTSSLTTTGRLVLQGISLGLEGRW